MSVLFEFAANEIGWENVIARLERAAADYRQRAADADSHDEHLDQRGRMRGVMQSLALIDAARREFRAAK